MPASLDVWLQLLRSPGDRHLTIAQKVTSIGRELDSMESRLGRLIEWIIGLSQWIVKIA